jgi:hypothetical protein
VPTQSGQRRPLCQRQNADGVRPVTVEKIGTADSLFENSTT